MAELMDLTICELAHRIRTGAVTPLDTVRAAFARIRERNGALNAFVVLCEERALEEARRQTEDLARGVDPGPLAGIPLGVKDLEDAAGLPTSYGSQAFAGRNVAERDSVQVARLRAAGAIVVGKTNVPLFGQDCYTRNVPFGTTRSPWDLARTPGGSSGGSAAALAGGLVPLVTAADGGGSIRIPASFVGAFGLKPTRGLVPMTENQQFGMLPFVHCTHFGPLCRSVEDAALVLDVTKGYHPADPGGGDPAQLSFPTDDSPPFQARLHLPSNRPLRIAYSPDFGYMKVQRDVLEVVTAAVERVAALGHHVERVPLELPDLGMEWLLHMGAQQYALLGIGAPDVPLDQLEPKLVKSFKLTSTLSVEDTGRAMRRVGELNRTLTALFGEYDLLLSPAMPYDPFPAEGPQPAHVDGEDFDQPWHVAGFMFPFNFSGHPAAVLRAGLSAAGYPVGLQIVGERHQDALILQLAHQYEQAYRPLDAWPAFPFPATAAPAERAKL